MKKLFYLTGIFLIFLTIVQPAAAGPLNGETTQGEPPPLEPKLLDHSIFLPSIINTRPSYMVSGQIKDAYDQPLSGVSVTSDTGEATLTNGDGVYSLAVESGERQLTAAKTGYDLDPAPAWLNLNQNMNNVDFSSAAACVNPIPNPSFEIVPYYWNPISGSANGYTPYYSSARAHSGVRSGFTGIPVGYENLVSWSRWRSHEITIPVGATSADVTMFVWPRSTEVALAADMKTPDGFIGKNADEPYLPNASDAQYIAVIDANNIVLGTLLWARSNAQAWMYSGALSLLPWAGSTVRLEFGVYNDGFDGVTSAFFDDVVATVCNGVVPVGCTNLLVNSDFEAPGAGWTIRPAATPSSYVNSFFYSPITSMLSGIPVGAPPPQYGAWRTSEFFQYVSIPWNATSAKLKVRLLPRSSDLYGYHVAEQAAMDRLLASTNAPEAAESQYGYICTNCADPKNPTTLRTLFRWFPIDSVNWLYREFSLLEFRGNTVGVLFGAQDYGDFGNTALYVDDAVLEVCTP